MKIVNPIARRFEIYRAMSDPTRVGVALATLTSKPVRFNEIKRAVKIKNSQILVYHLNRLIRAGLVRSDQKGYIATPKLWEFLEKEGFVAAS